MQGAQVGFGNLNEALQPRGAYSLFPGGYGGFRYSGFSISICEAACLRHLQLGT